jgi:hypothetical protein
MGKKYIIFDKEMLDSMIPSQRGIKFVLKFFRLTRLGRARISFSKNDLKRWLFPLLINAPIATKLIDGYDKAIKLNN